MRVITLYPEWAWAICYLGKNIENRKWLPNLEPGEKLAIHAGATRHAEALEKIFKLGSKIGHSEKSIQKLLDEHPIQTGCIVAVVEYKGSCDNSKSPWAVTGWNHWRLAKIKVLSKGIPARGQQNLWTSTAVN